MKFLSIETLIEKIKTIGGGEFHSLTFVSNPKVKKEYGDRVIHKISTVSIRTKLDHENTKRYKDYLAERGYIGERAEDSTYILDKALKKNNKTGNTLFMVIPRYDTFRTHYEDEDGNEIPAEKVAEMTYKKSKSDTPPYVISVNASKVIDLV